MNVDIPDDLLQEWMRSSAPGDIDPIGYQLAVFSFGYLYHDLVINKIDSDVPRSIAATKILELFNVWQVKLALAAVDRATGLRTSALPLFSFSEDEQVEGHWSSP